MSTGLSPVDPVQADHRFIMRMTTLTVKDGVLPIPSEFDRVSRVFSKAGGSWKRIFGGSIEDIELLKKVIKEAVKHGFLTKKEKWS